MSLLGQGRKLLEVWRLGRFTTPKAGLSITHRFPSAWKALQEYSLLHTQKAPARCPYLKCRAFSRPFHSSGSMHSMFEDRDTKALTVWTSLKEVKKSPLPALALGLSGLIPFMALPVYMVYSHSYLATIAFAQVAYGASILSFLGGVRWGFTLPPENPVQPDWVNLGYSVVPSLIAWTGLLLPCPLSLFTVMGGLVFAGYIDMAMWGYPPWFKGLRFTLTFVAILSLWTTFMCSFLLPVEGGPNVNTTEKKDEE